MSLFVKNKYTYKLFFTPFLHHPIIFACQIRNEYKPNLRNLKQAYNKSFLNGYPALPTSIQTAEKGIGVMLAIAIK